MNKLLKDAIADAKTVRETALANAKAVLEEAFAPKLQSMLSHKIKEEMEETEEEEPADEEQMEVAKMQSMAGITSDEDPDNEGMKNYMEEDDIEVDSDEDDMEVDSEEDDMEVDSDEDDMEVDSEEGKYPETEEEMEPGTDEDLEEILRELENEEETEEPAEETMDDENTYMENHEGEEMEMDSEEEEIDLEEIISALREEDEDEMDSEEEPAEEEPTVESVKELQEAYSVIKFLRSKINEVNLLNAKLLFVNKLFRKGELTESQKVKIIETFDRAKNVREAKLIYATLAESVNGKSTKPVLKRKMNEGYASAPQKKTQIIAESNNIYSRFKSLVDYNQHNQ